MLELTRQNFRTNVGSPKTVLIECWAPGCGACARFDPVFEKVALEHPEHLFARMDVSTEEKLGDFFGIEFTPALMLYRDGLLLLKQPGAFTEEQLGNVIRQAESLDMERVKADLAPPPESGDGSPADLKDGPDS